MIETDRLLLRPFVEEDRDDFRALVTDPVVTGEAAQVVPREDCDALFDFYLACWREEGLAYGAIERRADGRFLGMAGLARCPRDPAPPVWEIGWALLPEFEGRGYAVEAAAGWLGYGFDHLGLDRITALTWTGNPRSRRLIDRLGFLADPNFEHPDGQRPADRLAFAITPARFRSHRAEVPEK